jgi:glutaminyl-tRNA synthetase
MAVLKPLKLIIDNWSEELSGDLEAVNNPEDESSGTRTIHFGRELWIEQDDFEETPPPKYFRLFPGNAVRLRYGYIVTCTGCDKDPAGNITAVHCACDPETRGGNAGDNRKVKGTIHWLNAADAVPIQVRSYDYLFTAEKPMEAPLRPDGTPGTFLDTLNGNSLEIISGAYGEPCLAAAAPGERFQFERLGYFVKDDPVIDAGPEADEGGAGTPVFNKTVGLRDTWAKIAKKTNS